MPFDARDRDGRNSPPMKLVGGNSNRPLAEAIGAYLKLPSPRAR